MRTLTTLLVAAALGAPAAIAQEPADWRMPFRSPQANLVPPEAMWLHLRPMYEIARAATPELKGFDQNGVEVIDDPIWERHYLALQATRQDAGYVSVVLRESKHVADRAIALYGGFYHPDPVQVLQLIAHIPGEPERAIREDAYVRAVEYLRVHLPAKVPGDLEEWNAMRVGPGAEKPPQPGEFRYGLDVVPFVALLELDDARDHQQALWFLSRCAEIRPKTGRLSLDIGKSLLRSVVEDGTDRTRTAVSDYLELIDPVEDREVPGEDADRDAWLAWYDSVVHDIFPPIRRVSEGLFDLYPSADRDALVKVGKTGLTAGSLATDHVSGTNKHGAPFRGCRIEALPEPLDQLGLEAGITITAINGVPVADQASILALVERSASRARSFLVEFVDHQGEQRAIEYRLR